MEDLTTKGREVTAPKKLGFERGVVGVKRVCEPWPCPVVSKES